MKIVGVSFDSPSANQSWAEKEEFTFELWSDDDKTLALTYGSVTKDSAPFAGRVTRILDSDGSLLVEYDAVAVGTSPYEVLADATLIYGQ